MFRGDLRYHRSVRLLVVLLGGALLVGCGSSSSAAPFRQNDVAIAGVTMQYYDVIVPGGSDSMADVRWALSQASPVESFDARVDWHIGWAFAHSGDDFCDPRTVAVGPPAIVVVFPRLLPQGPLPKILTDIWSRYLYELAVHEAGHVQIVLESIAPMEQEMRAAGTCPEAEVIAHRWLVNVDVKSHEYDLATDHGAASGAQLP
jgi:predicted secreted Zn-dependent protease